MVATLRSLDDHVEEPSRIARRNDAPQLQGGAISAVQRIAGALRRAGLAADGEAVTEHDHVAGGALEWWLLDVGAGRGAWVQHLRDPRLRPDATRVMRTWDVVPRAAATGRDGVHLVAPIRVAPATYAYPVDAGTELFAAMLLRGLGVGGTPRRDWLWLPPLCARLGATLRDFHEPSPGAYLRPRLPRGNDVIRRVRGLLGADAPPRLAPVRAALDEFPRLRATLATAVRRLRVHPGPVMLHGRYAPGEMLVESPVEHVSPAVYVAGWLAGATGPPAYDAGYFIGELMELAATASDLRHGDAEQGLHAAASEFYDAYAFGSAAPLPDGFTLHVAEFAALKMVEHLARFAQYFGDPGPEAVRLLRAADALLCPKQGLARILAGRYAARH